MKKLFVLLCAIAGWICSTQAQTPLPAEVIPDSVRVLSTVTNLSGISAILRRVPDDGKIHVVGVIEGGPAEKAGLRINDVIVSVDGEPTSGEELESVVARLRGAPGTKVSLVIERAGTPQTLEVSRGLVRLKDVVAPVEIDVQGDRYWIGKQEVSLAMLTAILQDRASRDNSWPVKIKTDPQNPNPALQSILEKCRDANLTNVEVISPEHTSHN